MRETIYLAVSRRRVERLSKRFPDLKRGEIPVKLTVTVDEGAFREPVIEREVTICDWRDGIDISDVDFTESFITEQEAELIRAQRLEAMSKVLQSKGYTVRKPSEVPGRPL
jgi:hypothetical protein